MSLEEEKFHREQKKMRSAGRYDKTSSGGKLKNETSARKAVRMKIRYGKSVSAVDINKKAARLAACCYFLGFPASERFPLTLPSLLRSRG